MHGATDSGEAMRRSGGGRPVLGVDVRALVEGYLRGLARSRDELTRHYRAEGNAACC